MTSWSLRRRACNNQCTATDSSSALVPSDYGCPPRRPFFLRRFLRRRTFRNFGVYFRIVSTPPCTTEPPEIPIAAWRFALCDLGLSCPPCCLLLLRSPLFPRLLDKTPTWFRG